MTKYQKVAYEICEHGERDLVYLKLENAINCLKRRAKGLDNETLPMRAGESSKSWTCLEATESDEENIAWYCWTHQSGGTEKSTIVLAEVDMDEIFADWEDGKPWL